MAKVLLRQEAIDDLSDIWHYTLHEWSENQAEKYYETIKFSIIVTSQERERETWVNSIIDFFQLFRDKKPAFEVVILKQNGESQWCGCK